MVISVSPRPGHTDGVPHGWTGASQNISPTGIISCVSLSLDCCPLPALNEDCYSSDICYVVSMHSLQFLLLFIAIFHSHSILAAEDHSTGITIPSIIPLDFQPKLPHRNDTESSISSRDSHSDTCPSNYQQCGNGLPSDFCCSSGDSCVSLADNTSALCCPQGSGTCSSILPITCSLDVQNATAYPTSSLHTVNLDGQLPTCGNDTSGTQTCCPFGYECNGNSVCVVAVTEAETPVSTGTLATATTTPSLSSMTMTTTSPSGSANALVTAEGTYSLIMPTFVPESDKHSSSNSSSRSKSIGIAAGSAVGGAAALAGFLVFAWVKRRRLMAKLKEQRRSISQRFSSTPPPLPPKEAHQIARKKRKSMLSWVPSVINRTPVELPATPVSYGAWNNQWTGLQPPNMAHRPYPRDSMSVPERYELDARWLPQGVR